MGGLRNAMRRCKTVVMTSSLDRSRSVTSRGTSFPSRVLTGGGGFPRRSGLAIVGTTLGLLAMLVLLAVLFTGVGSWVVGIAALVALVSAVCVLLALFRDWGRARVGVTLVLAGDILIVLMAAAMLFHVEATAPLASAVLVALVACQLVGAVLVHSAPRTGRSRTPRAVEPSWPARTQ